ncbi:MAG TPA: NAD(P)/FAD-dependent oxidoreductase [Acidobacteriaceae bacterium]|nr:NAD(P)/FAD-dependent oxidoreductase [Acidobacteriaceae bacterium]
MNSYDAVVVGSGPNGLSAAIVLARAGLSVLVREANSTIGGGTRSLELTLPGFLHDLCSAVHPMALASPFFRSLPLDQHGLEWIHPPLPLAHPLDDAPPAVLDRSVTVTGAALAPDSSAYRRLIAPLVDRWDQLAPEILAPVIHLPARPVALSRFGLRALWPAQALARTSFRGERARALFAGLAAHSIVSLEEPATSAIGLVLAAAGHAAGWPIPRGGSQRIAEALASYLRSLGGTIETDAPVDNLDGLPPARAILFDVTPRQLLRIAGSRMPERYMRSLSRFAYGPGVFKIDWALAAPIPWIDAECARTATVHLGGSASEIEAGEKAAWNGKQAEKPFVLLAQSSLFDPARAPAGQHTGWAYCHVPNGSTEDKTSAIEAQVERFAPGFRELILGRHTANAEQLEHSNANLIGGDIGGGANNLWQLVARPVLSPDPYRTPAKDLYLCSASTPPGGGVHGMCGYHAACSALRHTFGR